MEVVTRGIRNNNPFNIRISSNTWLGKVKKSEKHDNAFEEFRSIDYGLRAGIVLFRGYINRGFDTPKLIINRFAPSSENNVDEYLHFINSFAGLAPDEHIRCGSLEFYRLCSAICMFESRFHFTVNKFIHVCKCFRLSTLF